jgi:hypothetical protein
MRMNASILAVATVGILGAAACGGDDRAAENAALQNDLTLAAQQQTRLDSVSALEAGAATAPSSNVNAPAPTVRRSTTTSSTPRRTTSIRRSSSSGTSGSTAGTSSGTVTTTSGGDVVVQKNTKRDAAIGAAAGAIIGATTSRDKVKGAVIGGVVGGVLGGVIGNNVDVKKTKKPPV